MNFNTEQKQIWHNFGEMLNQIDEDEIYIAGRIHQGDRKSFVVMVTTTNRSHIPTITDIERHQIKQAVNQENYQLSKSFYEGNKQNVCNFNQNNWDTLAWKTLSMVVLVFRKNRNNKEKLKSFYLALRQIINNLN